MRCRTHAVQHPSTSARFVERSNLRRGLARLCRAHSAGGSQKTAGRITWAWQQALSRPPRADELKAIETLLDREQLEYAHDEKAADAFLHVGQKPKPADLDSSELAAWTNVA